MSALPDVPATPYAEAAQLYYRAGWSPIPLPTNAKHPVASGFTGAQGATPSAPDIQSWIDDGFVCEHEGKRTTVKAGNIALRLPPNIIGLDVDMYVKGGQQKAGRASLEELEARYGKLPPTWSTTARNDGSAIRLFRVPEGLAWPGNPRPGIEVIQYRHRYAMVWPSRNPDADGAVYRWWHDDVAAVGIPSVDEIPDMPPAWVEGLTGGALAEDVDKLDLAYGQVETWLREHAGDVEACPRMLRAQVRLVGDVIASGTGARHDAAVAATQLVAHLAAEGHTGALRALRGIRAAFAAVTSGEDRPGEWNRLVAGAVGVAAARSVHTMGDPCRDPYSGDPELRARVHELPRAGPAVHTGQPPAHDSGIWDVRPELRFIKEAATAQLASPWSTLGIVLARVIAATPEFVVLPRIVGGYGSLNSFFALVGQPGLGKGISTAVAEDCWYIKSPAETFNAGSGEGLAHLYAMRVKMPKEEGGGTRVERIRKSVLLNVPEVDTLTALGGRQGATLLAQLRQGWSGENLGFAYANPEKALPIEPHSYRLAMVVGVQPERAGALMDDAGGGTPQRFVWLATRLDPNVSAEDYDETTIEPWHWENPGPWHSTNRGRAVMAVPDCIRKFIRDQSVLMRTRPEEFAFDQHHYYARLKVAAAFGLLASRNHVTEEDWELSGELMRVSDIERTMVLNTLNSVKARAAEQSGTAEGFKDVARSRVVIDDHLRRAIQCVMKHSSTTEFRTLSHYVRKANPGVREYLETAMEDLVIRGIMESRDSQRGALEYRLR